MNYPQEKIKPYNADEKKSVQVEKMFDNIAPAYDQLNQCKNSGYQSEQSDYQQRRTAVGRWRIETYILRT